MKIIAITLPMAIDEDLYLMSTLLDNGIDTLHLRKPLADIDYCRMLLRQLAPHHRAKIVVHDYPDLYNEFALKGIHINKNVVALPEGYNGVKTRSCHSIDEVVKFKGQYDYLFLSPIFNSISKPDYQSAFTHSELSQASLNGIIDAKVIALGGVTFDRIPYLKELNFGGVAMMGGLYHVNAIHTIGEIDKYR